MVYEKEINKLEKYLKIEKDYYQKIKLMDTLRYFYKENEKDKERVVYKAESDSLEYSKSINIAIEITKLVPQVLDKIEEDKKSEVVTIMKNNYYYLSGYLFSYYVVAIEFGIPPEKQFFAPRTSVLGPISKKLDKFYYKPKAVMTISMPQGTGKEQPLSSKILTPEGWITMGEVKVGTKVIGADGKVCNVTGVFPKGIKDVYRVTFDDHTYVDCGLEHLWEVQTRYDRRNKKDCRIVNTEEMLKNYKIKNLNNYSVRLVKPIQFKNKLTENDLHPYLLGCLIGNGNFRKDQIRLTQNDEEVINRIREKLPFNIKIQKYSQNYQYGIVRKNKKGRTKNLVSELLKQYGLLEKKSHEKFIPDKYLFSNINNRIELLRGLMDTDGNSFTNNSGAQYTTTSEKLKDNVIELIRGLGGKATYKEDYNNIKIRKK